MRSRSDWKSSLIQIAVLAMPTLPLRSNCLQVTGKCLGNAACTRLAAPILARMRFWEHIAHLAPFLRILKRDNLWHTARDWWHASAPFPHPAHQTGRADFAHRLSDRDSVGFAHGRLVLERARRTRPAFA